MSTHTAELPLPALPRKSRIAHLFPALKGTSLLSVSQLCDAGCTATFKNNIVEVTLNAKTILTGQRCPHTKLWTAELKPPATALPSTVTPQAACNVTLPTTAASLVRWHLACLFSPALTTVENALKRKILPLFPGLNPQSLKKCGTTSMSTQKGHLDQLRAGQGSTQLPQDIANETLEHVFPQITPTTDQHHCCFASIAPTTKNGNQNVSFSDQTGRFPFASQSGNQHLFVFYHYDMNCIHIEPMKNKTQGELLRVCTKTLAMFTSSSAKPSLHMLDHEAPQVLKNCMHSIGVNYQLTPPGTHRRNLCERAIRTAKSHIISGLSSAHPKFPMNLWDQILPQAEMTLNMLRGSRMNPKLSARTQLHGILDQPAGV